MRLMGRAHVSVDPSTNKFLKFRVEFLAKLSTTQLVMFLLKTIIFWNIFLHVNTLKQKLKQIPKSIIIFTREASTPESYVKVNEFLTIFFSGMHNNNKKIVFLTPEDWTDELSSIQV